MNKMQIFIKKYLTPYLLQCRTYNPLLETEGITPVPPTSRELEMLVSYLLKNGVDFAIVGSVAVARYLELMTLTHNVGFPDGLEDQLWSATQDIDFFVSQSLPPLPKGWKRDIKSIGVASWISPSGGYVDFLMAGHRFPDSNATPKKIEKDPESINTGWPIADITSLFLLKLNSFRDKDLFDLVVLAHKVGISEDQLRKRSLNETQTNNLETVRMWLEHGDLLK
jgi:hypothetical protein